MNTDGEGILYVFALWGRGGESLNHEQSLFVNDPKLHRWCSWGRGGSIL